MNQKCLKINRRKFGIPRPFAKYSMRGQDRNRPGNAHNPNESFYFIENASPSFQLNRETFRNIRQNENREKTPAKGGGFEGGEH